MRVPVDLVGGFYTDDSLPWSCQDTVNYIPVAAEASGTRTVSKLVDAPGLRPFVWIGHTEEGTLSAPIRGMHDVEGRLFVVCGRTLYEISNKGVAIPRGEIPGVGRVSMAHNQRSGGNELIVVNGSAGFVWNTGTEQFSIITDAGYPGAAVVEFIDGYLMQVEPFGRFLFHSDLADALEYNTLDRFEAETAPDRTLGMIVNHQEVWAFGERTVDVFGNAGTAQGTFQNKGVSIARGCAAKWSPAVIDNGVAWLGDDLKVYHATGYSPIRISTRAIESALSECSRNDLRNAFAFVWEDLSHAVYYLTVPNGPTFGYDFSTGLWHRRSSWHPVRDLSGRWRVNDLVKHNGEWIAGDYQTGKLYKLDWDYMLEGCEPLVRERVSPVAHNDARGFVLDSAEVLFDTGGQETECIPFPAQPQGPSIEGEAPDADQGGAYTFTYTTTAGSAPILRTVLRDTVLPSGWAWNEATATISHDDTPVPIGSITLHMRVIDANGLYADHTDTFVISEAFLLLVTGSAKEEGGPVFAKAVALGPTTEFDGIPTSTGADLDAATATYHDGEFLAINKDGVVVSSGTSTWTAGTVGTYPPVNDSFFQVAGGPDGYLAVVPNLDGSPTTFCGAGSPPDFTRTAVNATLTDNSSTDYARRAPNLIRAEDGFIVCFRWSFLHSTDAAGPYTAVWDALKEVSAGRNPNGQSILWWHDLAEHDGEWYAAITWDYQIEHRRSRIIKSSARDNWNNPTVVVDVPFSAENDATSGNIPAQLCVGGGHIVSFNTDGTLWTSANGWAEPIATGLQGPGRNYETEGWMVIGGRRIVHVAPLFYVLGAGDELVTFNPETLEVSDPIELPIADAFSIAAGSLAPEEE